jgi:hypothetical protein
MRQRSLTPGEIEACVGAIAAAYPGSVPLGARPALSWALESDNETVFYIDFMDASQVPPGGVYATWTVKLDSPSDDSAADVSAEVSFFRSKVRESGDGSDTLPPS